MDILKSQKTEIVLTIVVNFHFGISSAFYFISLFFGSAGNYLFLFFYWFVVDLYKKKKQDS